MFHWQKLGKVFDPSSMTSPSWMSQFAQSPSSICFDAYTRVFFSSRPAPDAQGMFESRIGYIDLDNNDLSKILAVSPSPILSLGAPGEFDEHGTYPVSVIQDGDVLKAYYAGWSRCESVPFNAAIGLAVSEDNGKSFNKIGRGPVLSYSSDEPFLIGSPKIRKFQDHWYLFYVSGKEWNVKSGRLEPIYKIRMARSDDGINWVKHGKDLLTDKLGANECQASPDVFFLNGGYHMLFSYRQDTDYKTGSGSYQVGYAYSEDLATWTRDDAKAGLNVSATGWDSNSISYANVFHHKEDIYALYQGNEMGKYGFGLAKLLEFSE